MLYSYDIFDTLITRATYTAKGINAEMQILLQDEESIPGYIRQNYLDIRSESEVKARKYHELIGDEEVTIDQIFEFLSEYDDFVNTDLLKNQEIDLENKYILPINERIYELKEKIKSGNSVILISDMYLRENDIRNMLISIDPIFETIPIYVSSEYNMTKNVGSLYAYIHNKLNIEYKDWTHIGDNFYSDYLIPKALGINCELVKTWKEYYWINELKQEYNVNSLEMQIILGLVRYISDEKDSDLAKLGKSYAGIILEEYAEWIVDRAIKDKIEQLYFIARDGYVIKRIVDRILQQYKVNIQTEYIYGSRKAWRVSGDKQAENLVKQYFKENIAFEKSIAFVDANGYGISIATVSDILGELWDRNIPIYYFSFHRQVENHKCKFYNYCYNASDIIELLCSATHGTTVGYKKVDGRIEPILDESTATNNINEYIDGILQYTDAMLMIKHKLDVNINIRSIVKNLVKTNKYKSGMSLEELWNAINSSEVTCTDLTENTYIVNKLKRKDAQKIIIYGAGTAGKRIFNELNKKEDILIVAWADVNYEKYEEQSVPVISINEAIGREYDYIVIAIKNGMAIKSAKCILKELSVEESKIYCLNE